AGACASEARGEPGSAPEAARLRGLGTERLGLGELHPSASLAALPGALLAVPWAGGVGVPVPDLGVDAGAEGTGSVAPRAVVAGQRGRQGEDAPLQCLGREVGPRRLKGIED